MLLKLLLSAHLATALKIKVSDAQPGIREAGENAIDNNNDTIWHSQWNPLVSWPHIATLDLESVQFVNGLSYLPRQGNSNGRIGQYTLDTSTDNVTWTQAATGSFIDDESRQNVGFSSRNTRYVRLTALSEAGGRGNRTSAAELTPLNAPKETVNGQWGPYISLPLVPAAAFVVPTTGKVVVFSSNNTQIFGGGNGNTRTAILDPVSGVITQYNVVETQHDMFCPGMSFDAKGNMIVTGGDNKFKTSIYNSTGGYWRPGKDMVLGRGYQSTTITSEGRIFNIGGSWSDGAGSPGNKTGEIYDPVANTSTHLPGALVGLNLGWKMLTNDVGGFYRADNHGWLFGWKNGYVFQAGPSWKMNWYGTSGTTGSWAMAGTRGSTLRDQMCGNAVMYDALAGKIVTFGGSPNYEKSQATNAVHHITLGAPLTDPAVSTLEGMTYRRAFGNAVVLPNGKVMVLGGQSYPVPFSDDTATKIPELWDPATQKFTLLPEESSPRAYHSIALLLPDARVLSGGGGLCDKYCNTNHFDAQVYSPAYLFDTDGTPATRPTVTNISATELQVGATFQVTTDTTATGFSMIRYGSATHTVNTDQRRIPLVPTATSGTTYALKVPGDSGVALPGYWMVFAMNANGTPSLAKTVRVFI